MQHHVDSITENCWCDLIDYSSLLDDGAPPSDFYGSPLPPSENVPMSVDVSSCCCNVPMSIDVSLCEITAPVYKYEERVTAPVYKSEERGFSRKRGRSDLHGGIGAKAGRERERRGKLNDRFLQLSAILEPERPVKTEKLAILSDAMRLLKHLKTESQEYEERNKRLIEEIKVLKVEKNELREEKLKLKADIYMMEQQLKTMNVPPIGFTTSNLPMYQADVKKVSMLPSYGFVPMWQYLSPSVRDTTQDHALRPPAA